MVLFQGTKEWHSDIFQFQRHFKSFLWLGKIWNFSFLRDEVVWHNCGRIKITEIANMLCLLDQTCEEGGTTATKLCCAWRLVCCYKMAFEKAISNTVLWNFQRPIKILWVSEKWRKYACKENLFHHVIHTATILHCAFFQMKY